jgi:hypothetical protein
MQAPREAVIGGGMTVEVFRAGPKAGGGMGYRKATLPLATGLNDVTIICGDVAVETATHAHPG